MQPIQPIFPLPQRCFLIRSRRHCAHQDICGEGGWENLTTDHGTWEKTEASENYSKALEPQPPYP